MRCLRVEIEPSFFKPIRMDLSFAKSDIYEMSKLSGRKLSALIQGFPVRGVEGALSQEISSIAFDSREVEDGGLFVAIRGFKQDGFKFVNDAIASGASAFITETPIEELSSLNLDQRKVAAICVKDCRSALAWVGAEFYGRPSDRMDVYGVTGTNGKTTVTYILESIYKAGG